MMNLKNIAHYRNSSTDFVDKLINPAAAGHLITVQR